jgi:hypothetical protein
MPRNAVQIGGRPPGSWLCVNAGYIDRAADWARVLLGPDSYEVATASVSALVPDDFLRSDLVTGSGAPAGLPS